jgi:hypothetical protein
MKARHVAFALLLAFAPSMVPVSVCHAQAPGDDATTAMARARFKEGVDYFDKGQFDLARAAFLQAYALKKHPAVLLNLAWSCLKSGHTLEAEREFTQFLAEAGDITDKQRADANDGLAQAHAKLGRIEIAAVPQGTEVSVDGEGAGTAPLKEPILVEAGTHSVKLRAPDGLTDTENVTVSAGEKATVHFAKPATGAPGPAAPPAAPTSQEGSPATTLPEPAAVTHAPQAAVQPVAPPESHAETAAYRLPAYPLVIGGVLGAAGIAVAIVMKIEKDSAQSKADTLASQISDYEAHVAMPRIVPARCTASPSMTPLPKAVVAACAQWNTNNNDVNQDAVVGNIAGVIGGISLAGAIAYGVVYGVYNNRAATPHATLTPWVGPSTGGLSFSARF